VVVVLEIQLLPNKIMPESNLRVKAVYTDGACSGNPGPGGWGVLVQFTNGQQQELGGSAAQTTNNRMELQAAIEAVKFLENSSVPSSGACIYTDSEYVKNGITKWLLNWKKRGWKTAQGKPVLNQDLWETLDALKPNQHDWQYIKAHAGHLGNERADAIARAFSLKQNPHLASLEDLRVSTQSNFMAKVSPEPLESILASKEKARSDSVKETSYPESTETKSIKQQELAPLERLMISLQHADAISSAGFLISTPELAELMESDLSTILHRGDRWTWRNWKVSQVREEDGQILWQLERIHNASV
jgi:ribonuclease HI